MARKRSHTASRDVREHRLIRGLAIAVFGLVGGVLLGLVVIGNGFDRSGAGSSAFADLSANPDALVTDIESAPLCRDCTDSYGVAARLRAEREGRLSDPFRRLGEVDAGAPLPPDDGDAGDYRYGGRFPDPPGSVSGPAMVIPVALPAAAENGPDRADAAGEAQTKDSGAVPEPSIIRD